MKGRRININIGASFFGILLSGLILACKDTRLKNTDQGEDTPNIVWIIAEDLSPDLACYGNRLVHTPTLDDLASQGIKYTNTFTTAPVCSPSRTALITGFYQNGIGAHHMRYPDALKPTLPEGVIPMHIQLKEKGYQTANIRSFPGNGKTDWLFRYDADTYTHGKWEEIDNQKPFFARINLGLTHRKFGRDSVRPINPDEVKLPPYYPDHPVSRRDWANYLESVQLLDGQVDDIMEDLRKNGLLDNTLIFFFSDHGRPMSRGKNYLYESGLKVPLIISSYDKRIRANILRGKSTDEDLHSLIDVTATTLELAGINTSSLHGKPFLGESNPVTRDFVFAAADRIGESFFKSRTVRGKRFRYIRNYNKELSVNATATAYRKANHPIYHLLNVMNEEGMLNTYQEKLVQPMVFEELYDLENDPYEIHNLAGLEEWADELNNMRMQLDNWIQEIDDKGLSDDSPEIITAFEAYGEESARTRKEAIDQLRQEVVEEWEKNMVNQNVESNR